MKLKYKLTEDDFLAYQLFTASQSKRIKKKRFRSRIILPLFLTFLGILAILVLDNMFMFIVYTITAILWYVVYPVYSKKIYKNHYRKYIEENYQDRINQFVKMDVNTDSISSDDENVMFKLKANQIKELTETSEYFFLKIMDNQSLILPKRELENPEAFANKILSFGTKHVEQLDWTWR